MVPADTLAQSIGSAALNVGGAVMGVWAEGIDGSRRTAAWTPTWRDGAHHAWRVGLVLHNLAEPTFGPEVTSWATG